MPIANSKGKTKIGQDEVNFVLSEYPETRDNDDTLFWRILDVYGIRLEFVSIVSLVNIITRCRRKIQSQGKLLPLKKEVFEGRFVHSKLWANKFRHNKKQIHEVSIIKAM